MSITSLDGVRFAEMVMAGAEHLSANAKMVDALNVFPVPDGDTGTNMNLSMTSGAKEVKNNLNAHIGKVAASLSKGLLMGARGNSGVILSQLFRGFAKEIERKSSINSLELAHAFEAGVTTAYKAVMKPVEGTILTVAKDAAKKGVQAARKQKDIVQFMELFVEEAKASLNRTPELLPVLKEVGVVDSGGQGLLLVYEGFLAVLKGEKLPQVLVGPSMDELVNAEHHKSVQSFMNTDEIQYGYCTEFMVRFEKEKIAKHPFSEDQFRQDLSAYGDSLLVISDDEIAKIHIHSEQPGEVLTYGQRYGSLIKLKIENMREQHSSIVGEQGLQPKVVEKVKEDQQEYGIVTVSMGEGIAELFRSIGASAVIEGGQTMNPSTEDIVKAIEEVNAKKLIILPNNKNIIMAAEQAAEMVDVEAVVVPSKTVPQGITAMLAFNPSAELEQNKEMMTDALANVKTGQITYAVRDTSIDGIAIKKDDFMGIVDGKIVVTDKDKVQGAQSLLQQMVDEDVEILTILYGQDAEEEEINAIVQYIEKEFPDVEVEIHNGKQPLYSFIFSVE
ncbi:DAK2 domain fusion protein YloV [Oikeobacillus pervagus]|uniref:DAK2 domain fusion protein YloV n=1 Tax=Oikeobacillus pervagus TaxID=1325931 RepID=A0AAJ1WIW7_9BACI|nr:DAK2 domain-containing protein [Oikeobacillus pervagus]MDQ0215085.1 DAK2 domain fusion protein YloV [Oikeobacillus pervagus]